MYSPAFTDAVPSLLVDIFISVIESPALVINPGLVIPSGRPDDESNVNSLFPSNVIVLLIVIVRSA